MQLIADANVPLSAAIGGRARLFLRHPTVEKVFTTEAALACAELPVTVIDRFGYEQLLPMRGSA